MNLAMGPLSLDKAAVRECLPNVNGSDKRSHRFRGIKRGATMRASQSFTLRGKKPIKPVKATPLYIFKFT